MAGSFQKIEKYMKSAKEMEKFGLDKFGIQVIKPSANFASRLKRFETGSSPKTNALIDDDDKVKQ